ncbi:hypothetical protein EYF80_009184 [Liparis tanakae]|uniref:Uncharacterized protein n=1 Tax=Liparis tanakae TaxID=230148 RepID=A0A4Z2IS59_9TELE|nr:hypothetical protein EYF80_009184 [Liparis tanakae]
MNSCRVTVPSPSASSRLNIRSASAAGTCSSVQMVRNSSLLIRPELSTSYAMKRWRSRSCSSALITALEGTHIHTGHMVTQLTNQRQHLVTMETRTSTTCDLEFLKLRHRVKNTCSPEEVSDRPLQLYKHRLAAGGLTESVIGGQCVQAAADRHHSAQIAVRQPRQDGQPHLIRKTQPAHPLLPPSPQPLGCPAPSAVLSDQRFSMAMLILHRIQRRSGQ